ncbi:Las1-domain-containing protein [Rhizodiscina lignyota]|uniref:Las1-domain-containing protein n=1 Tax=Rhizodiscina lignyota TaxID=1504668 RepID=A0A9P4IQG5_9PEZI|nr:Las1-domain-containing protein [Rhizodiscina lignyota]
MARIKIRPWRDRAEVLDVRKKLFLSNTGEHTAARRDATDMIEIWRRRARLPHAIESTALLVEAQLHQLAVENAEIGSAYATRAAFATALARFVTGFCDINQASVAKRSMFDVASDLHIPEQWVELRHQFTHGGELPALGPLERAVEGALAWLWDSFWSKLGDEDDEQRGVKRMRGVEEDMKAKENGTKLKAVLKSFVKERREEVKASTEGMTKGVSGAADGACARLGRFHREDSSSLDVLLALLVDERMIIPSGHTVGSTMSGAFILWDPLLLKLALSVRRSLVEFVLRMLHILTSPSALVESEDPYKEAISRWIEHVFVSTTWARRRKMSKDGLRQLRTEVVRECTLSSEYWTQALARKLTITGDARFREQWLEVVEANHLEESPREAEGDTQVTLVEENLSRDDTGDAESSDEGHEEYGDHIMAQSTFSAKDYGGWQPYPGIWRPVPIGIVEGEDEVSMPMIEEISKA